MTIFGNMNKLFALVFGLISILYSSQVNGQCGTDSLVLGNDTILCEGDSIILKGNSNFINHQWNTGSTDSNLVVDSSGVYVCSAQYMSSTNLVVNGDFSMGDTAFSSGYIYGTGGTWGLLSNPGQYAISTNSNLTHNNFVNCTDHTSGTGNFMIMNGASAPNAQVWCQTITILPNTNYVFSAWFMSVVSNSPGILEFSINGSAVGSTFNLTSTTCLWQNFYQTWTSGPTATTATICLTSQNVAASGNDFAIDDIYFAQVCDVMDTIQVDFNSFPLVDLGNDTVICTGNNLNLDVTDSATFTYLWSNGSTNPIQNITNTDSNLWVGVSNGNCTTFDTMIVTSAPNPQIDLGPDSIKCPGDTLFLDATWPNSTYLWQDNSTDTTFDVTTAGAYWVQVTDYCGVASDTVNVSYVQFPLATLGNDTTLCNGDSITVAANSGLDAYLWSDNSTNTDFTITNPGTYWVAATKDYCTDRDTITVNFDPTPVVNLGPDTTFCQGQNITLNVTNPNASYVWQNGSTNPIYFVAFPGTYSVTVSINNCHDSDSVVVNVIPLPQPNLGNDTMLCQGETLILDATNSNSTYVWNDASTDPTYSVTQTGTYWVEVTNPCGTVSETIDVVMSPVPPIELGPDQSICDGNQVLLDAKVSGATYLWSTTETSSSISVTQPGMYWVEVTKANCTAFDSIEIGVSSNPVINLGNDTVICESQPLTLNVTSTGGTYQWEDQSTNSIRTINSEGLYTVMVTIDGCSSSDSINVLLTDCDIVVEMPDIFTPNDDGANDLFQPIIATGITQVEFTIFNRWGAVIFESNNPELIWDGKTKSGSVAVDGVYFWTISAVGITGENKRYKGTVTIQK